LAGLDFGFWVFQFWLWYSVSVSVSASGGGNGVELHLQPFGAAPRSPLNPAPPPSLKPNDSPGSQSHVGSFCSSGPLMNYGHGAPLEALGAASPTLCGLCASDGDGDGIGVGAGAGAGAGDGDGAAFDTL